MANPVDNPSNGSDSGQAGEICSGEVVSVAEGRITISIEANPACRTCAGKSSCSLTPDGRQLLEIDGSGYRIGEKVKVVRDARQIMIVAFALYLVPTVLLILGSFLGWMFFPGLLGVSGDLGAFYGVVAGLLLSLAYVHFFRNLTGTREHLVRLEREEEQHD